MDIMSFKGHPPWYARGTPVTNIRDGPAMAINDKLLFAICRGSSARGKPGECMNEVGRSESEDQSRCKPIRNTRRWLTLNTTFFNTQNSVFSQWYALLGREWDIFIDADRSWDAVRSGAADLSACGTPDNVNTMNNNIEIVYRSIIDAGRDRDADRSEDAVRSEATDLSACGAPDNVKIMDDNINTINNNVNTMNNKSIWIEYIFYK